MRGGHPIPDEALDDRQGFVGTSGSGKTYGAGTAVERLLAKQRREIIIDPLGVWFGLRLMEDGVTPSGHDVVIFGGRHADISITANSGAVIGETVAGMAESCIVDLSDFGTKAAERRFMFAFLEALHRHAAREPVHIIFDEADMWAPQKILDREGDAARLLGMMETIVRRGRVKGFIPWLITQRPAVLSKDVLSQVDGLIAFKLTSSQDRKAIGAWVEGQADEGQWKRIHDALAGKGRGHAVVWLPGHGILVEDAAFPKKATFDSSATPKRGERRRTAELKPLDVKGLRQRLSTIEEEAKENDPKALKAEVAELRRQLTEAARPATRSDQAEIDEAEKRGRQAGFDLGYDVGFARGWREAGSIAHSAIASAVIQKQQAFDEAAVTELEAQEERARAAQLTYKSTEPATKPAMRLARVEDQQVARLGLIPDRAPAAHAPVNRIPENPASGQPQSSAPAAGVGSMLDALAICHPVRINPVLWGAFSRRSPVSGPWHKAVRELSEGGLIEKMGGEFRATAAGLSKASTKPAGAAIEADLWRIWRDRIRELVGASAVELLEILARHTPLTAQQWALLAHRSPVSGPWHAAIKQLKKWDCLALYGVRFGASEKGVALCGGFVQRSDTRAELVAARIDKLPGPAVEIYRALPGTRVELAKKLGKSHISGPWHAAVKALLSSGLAGETNKVIHTIEEDLG